MMKDIAVLIPVYNHLAYTKTCVKTLQDLVTEYVFTGIRLTVVVIDDGSTDGTGEWLGKNYPGVIVLRGDGDLWWSGAVNLGARYAIETLHSDYLLLWNNDIIADQGYFKEMDKLIPSLPGNVIAGSKIFRKGEDPVIWSFGGIFNPRTGSKYMLGLNVVDSGEYENPRNVDWLPGMGTLIPAGVPGKIGYWNDKDFPQYHGDSDFTYRAKLAGFDIVVFPQLRLWNDTTNTGLSHQGSLKVLIRLLTDIKSNYNLKKNLRFYRKYATSVMAYGSLIRSYYMLFGGFFKWKFLSLIGVRKEK